MSLTWSIEPNIFYGFHRLSINDVSPHGMQPMRSGNIYVQCNGQIYNHKNLSEKYGFKSLLKSTSDCEVIMHMYKNFGIEDTVKQLDGVFALTIYDGDKDILYAARDPIGVRPLFIGHDIINDGIFVASESKAIIDHTNKVAQFPPGHYWSSQHPTEFKKYWHLNNSNIIKTEEEALKNINELLSKATLKRLMSDRPIGCFLSGGLDSSLITALVQKYQKEHFNQHSHLNTYVIGMKGATDMFHAAKVAEYLKTNHHEVLFTAEQGIAALEDVIYTLETYDITTIRASVGMYLLSKYINENTDDIVIFSGEGSDEVTQGYLYFHNSPNPKDSAIDSKRLVDNLHFFDVKRVDRCVARNGLEVRVPFLDQAFMKMYFTIDENIRTPKYKGIEKYLVRKAFDNDKLLPSSILWRVKEAFSDGVSGHAKPWFKILQDYIDTMVSDAEFQSKRTLYKNPPITKEAYYYRTIYDKYFPDTDLIPYYWMPQWSNTNDPSARTLGKYNELIKEEQQQQSLSQSHLHEKTLNK
jgi:asparagine synthase (glutamine-hydrolysing)